eukprot:6000396-Prymnesium_polylepis.1
MNRSGYVGSARSRRRAAAAWQRSACGESGGSSWPVWSVRLSSGSGECGSSAGSSAVTSACVRLCRTIPVGTNAV